MSNPNIAINVTFHSLFFCRFIVSNFPSVPTVFHQFLTCIALCDVHLRFSLVLLRTASAVEEETE